MQKDIDVATGLLSELLDQLEALRKMKECGTVPKVTREELVAETAALLIEIKQPIRAINTRTEEGREAAAEAKRVTDQWHLKLQALKYQIHHYNTKIAQCRQLKSTFDAVPLVPLDEFLSSAPPQFQVAPGEPNFDHRVAVGRLQYELHAREALRDRIEEMKKHRRALADQIDKKDQSLGSLRKALVGVTATVEPLQAVLGVHTLTRHQLLARSAALPTHLYALFHQFADYKFARDDASVTVEIEGEAEAQGRDAADGFGDSDDEGAKKKRKRKHRSAAAGMRVRLTLAEDSKRGSLDRRSLSIVFSTIRLDGSLRIAGLDGQSVIGVAAEPAKQQDMLHDLFGPDPLLPLLPPAVAEAHPYTWAQVMAGAIHFPSSPSGVSGPGPIQASGAHAAEVVRRLRLRAEVAPSLQSQLQYLSKQPTRAIDSRPGR